MYIMYVYVVTERWQEINGREGGDPVSSPVALPKLGYLLPGTDRSPGFLSVEGLKELAAAAAGRW